MENKKITSSDLDNFKEHYEVMQKEFNLPIFDDLNEEFNIEKISEVETDFLIREVRKCIAEKFSNYLRFVETLLNPANAPMFVFSIINTFEGKDKELLMDIYKKLAKKEVELIELEIIYDEKKEIEYIKSAFKLWKNIQKDFLKIVETINKNWDVKIQDKGKNYFG